MTVTIIISTRNRASVLPRAVASVRMQSFADWELVVVDDGSSDDTQATVRELAAIDNRIVYLRNERPSLSIAGATNWALREARGKYVAILDDDDAWIPADKLARQVDFLDRNPSHVACGGGAIVVNQQGAETGRVLQPESDSAIKRFALLSNPVVNSSAMFRLDAARRIGLYDESLPQFADWAFWLDLGRIGRLHNFQEYFVLYTRWSGNSTFSNLQGNAKASRMIVRKFKGYYPYYLVALGVAYAYPLRSRWMGSFKQIIRAFQSATGRRAPAGMQPPVPTSDRQR